MVDEIKTDQMKVSTGTTDNDTVTTKGYVDDAVEAENLWDRDATGTPYLIPHTITDEIGTPTVRISKGWFTDFDISNDLTVSHYIQVGNIQLGFAGSFITTTSGDLEIDAATGDVHMPDIFINRVHFVTGGLSVNEVVTSISSGSTDIQFPSALAVWNAIQVENLWDRIVGTPSYLVPSVGGDDEIGAAGSRITKGWFTAIDVPTILSTTDLTLQSTSATGVVEILKDTGLPAFSYNNATNKFTFNDDIAITVGGDLEVNTINKYNAITGVTIEGVALLDGDITLPVNKKINFGDAIDTEFDLLDIDTGEALGLLFQYNRMNSLSGSVQLFRCQNPNAGDRAGFMTESIGSHAENYLTTRASGSGTYSYYGYMQNGIPSSSGGDRRMFEVGMNTTSNTYTIGYGSKAAGQVMVFTDHFKIDGATGDVEIPISLKIGSVLISGNTINTTAGALNLNSFSDAIFAEDLTVSSLTSNGKTVMNAAQFVGVTAVTTATHTVGAADYFIDVTRTTTGACTITILTADIVTGRSFYIKDGGGNAGTFNITFVGEGGELIDGLTSMVIGGDWDGARITCISSSAMRIS